MSKLIKYYLLISFFYIIEIYIFWVFQKIVLNDILLNFSIRIFFVIISSHFLRKNIFNNVQSFYLIFYSVALLNPLISSMFIYLILNFFSENVTFAKLLADIFTSAISFGILYMANEMDQLISLLFLIQELQSFLLILLFLHLFHQTYLKL